MSQSTSPLPNPPPAGQSAGHGFVSPVYPLEWFYNRSDKQIPEFEYISAEDLPEPYKKLLDHQRDMTSTLKKFHNSEQIWVQALEKYQEGNLYHRLVTLWIPDNDKSRSTHSSRPVEFGAIRIHLDRFPDIARQWILQESRPLGRILHDGSVSYLSRPEKFFKTRTDDWIGSALRMPAGQVVYGRCNVLWDGEATDQPLAEIVEILPTEIF